MNKDRIFNLFNNPDENPERSDIVSILPKDIKESPTWKINMFRKIITNHLGFKQKVALFFKKENKDWSDEKGEENTNFVIYNRAWYYIKDIDLGNKYHISELLDHDPFELSYCLQLTLKYFEKSEQYLKCAHLHKIIKFIEEIVEDSLE